MIFTDIKISNFMTYRIRDLIKWERLTGRSFASFDAGSEDDVVALLYASSGQDGSYTLEQYRRVYARSRHVMASELERLRSAGRVLAQYAAAGAAGGDEAAGGKEAGGGGLAEAAYALVAEGMDAGYLLDELPLWELRPLAEAFAERRRQEDERLKSMMEVWRLVAYWSVVPHVKRGSVKSPGALFRFPWEAAGREADGGKAIEEHGGEFRRLMEEGGGAWADVLAGGKGHGKKMTDEKEEARDGEADV